MSNFIRQYSLKADTTSASATNHLSRAVPTDLNDNGHPVLLLDGRRERAVPGTAVRTAAQPDVHVGLVRDDRLQPLHDNTQPSSRRPRW